MKSLFAKTCFGLSVIAGLLSPIVSQAAPVLGDKLFYTGGTLDVTILSTTAGYNSLLSLYLLNPLTTSAVFGWNHADLGTTYTYNPGLNGYAIGDELVFGIYVQDTGTTFFIGDAARNPDNLIHASVDGNAGSFDYLVGFEDLFGGGDLDYDDNVFGFKGGVTSSIPEPTPTALLAGSLLALAAFRRRRR